MNIHVMCRVFASLSRPPRAAPQTLDMPPLPERVQRALQDLLEPSEGACTLTRAIEARSLDPLRPLKARCIDTHHT